MRGRLAPSVVVIVLKTSVIIIAVGLNCVEAQDWLNDMGHGDGR